ncbi:hypothetical protein EV673_1815 [Limnobacter thiooxidans]|nr:hypothetical protein EV673_1815 [Limnobacter thiooxidans]
MWNGLFFGLVSLFTPQASLPDVAAVQAEVHQFSKVYAINTERIHVRESTMKNPSPFLTNSGIKACVLHINQNNDAKRVWSHFLNAGEEGLEPAFLAFTSGHELTHCLMSEPGKRQATRKALEAQLGLKFKNNVHFEETLADLVGLAYVARVAPEFYDMVKAHIKAIRTDFSSRDPEHNSSQAIHADHIAWVDALLEKPGQNKLELHADGLPLPGSQGATVVLNGLSGNGKAQPVPSL